MLSQFFSANKKTGFKAVLLSLAAFGAMSAAQAATDTTTFKVKITITESCLISTTQPTDVNFGSQARTTAAVALTAAGQLNVNCTSGTPYTVGLNGGLSATTSGGTANPVLTSRRMTNGSSFVSYDLYSNPGATTFWGNTSGSLVSSTGTGGAQTFPTYGKVISVNVPAGVYEDTVTATITY